MKKDEMVPSLAWVTALFAAACAHDGNRVWEYVLLFVSVLIVVCRREVAEGESEGN